MNDPCGDVGMKSSRQRFAEFKDKVKKGLLTKDRLGESPRPTDANAGGHHGPGRASPAAAPGRGPGGGMGMGMGGGGSGPANYQLKRAKKQLLSEYRVMLRGYYGPVIVLMLLTIA